MKNKVQEIVTDNIIILEHGILVSAKVVVRFFRLDDTVREYITSSPKVASHRVGSVSRILATNPDDHRVELLLSKSVTRMENE